MEKSHQCNLNVNFGFRISDFRFEFLTIPYGAFNYSHYHYSYRACVY